MNSKAFGLAAVAVAICTVPAFAHHSFAMFDGDKKLTLEGTVKAFDWTNPHSWIHFMVPNDQGTPVEWSIEMGGPGGLAHQGWTPKTLAPGMKITVLFHPMKDGSPGGQYLSITLPNGKVYGNGGLRPADNTP